MFTSSLNILLLLPSSIIASLPIMRSKASVKPSEYPKLPFNGIRFLIFLSSLVVGIILAVFIYHLHADGYKLPFAFLIVSLNPSSSDGTKIIS